MQITGSTVATKIGRAKKAATRNPQLSLVCNPLSKFHASKSVLHNFSLLKCLKNTKWTVNLKKCCMIPLLTLKSVVGFKLQLKPLIFKTFKYHFHYYSDVSCSFSRGAYRFIIIIKKTARLVGGLTSLKVVFRRYNVAGLFFAVTMRIFVMRLSNFIRSFTPFVK